VTDKPKAVISLKQYLTPVLQQQTTEERSNSNSQGNSPYRTPFSQFADHSRQKSNDPYPSSYNVQGQHPGDVEDCRLRMPEGIVPKTPCSPDVYST